MIDLSLQTIRKTYYQKLILESVSFEVIAGSKIGLIGRNGAGKTTLFKLITREESPDSGTVILRRGIRVGHLKQHPEHRPEKTVEQVLCEGFSDLLIQKSQMETLETQMAEDPTDEVLLVRYGKLQTSFEIAGGYDMDFRLKEIALNLKLESLLKQPFESLSGGEKTRVLFGSLLIEAPEVLLLDEPTNHLDADMLDWLERYLNAYEGSVLMISHDRFFLDQVAQTIIELELGQAEVYDGNYSWYAIEKEKRDTLKAQAYQLQQKKIRAIEAAIQRFELWGKIGDNEKFFKKANQFKARLDKMDKLLPPDHGQLRYGLKLGGTVKSSQHLIEAKGLSLGYGHKRLIENLDLILHKGQRLCLMGANGAGKTTFFKAILGEAAPLAGEMKVSPSATIGYIPQDIVFEDDTLSLQDWCVQTLGMTSGEARNHLAHYGFRDQEVFRALRTLSGGEKSRLKLIQLAGSKHTLLLMDEPTNHMDIPSREQLEALLTEYQGTLLVISHDRYFIDMVSEGILWLKDQTIITIDGGYAAYQTEKEQAKQIKNQKPVQKIQLISKERPKTYQKEKLRLGAVEIEIEGIEAELSTLAGQIQASASDYQALRALGEQEAKLKETHAALVAEWVTLSEMIQDNGC